MNKQKTLVFDIDDTICVHSNRDYENAKPIKPVIQKINELYDKGYYIKLFTGRGQLSCNGDLALIIERNQPILEKWLKKNNVKYNELIFGKPLGDWYIDDKAISVEDFLKAKFEKLKGGSNSEIYREHNKVIKTANNCKAQYEWYLKAKDFGIKIPKVQSLVGNTLYMDYIDGKCLTDCCTLDDIYKLYNTCKEFSYIKEKSIPSDIIQYCNNLKNHLNDSLVNDIIVEILNNSYELQRKSSFYHGDLTLGNIIKYNDELYLIDPNYKNDYKSYLLDLAKIRQSLHDYEYMFGFSEVKNSKYLDYFDELLEEDLYMVKLLEITHWIRMYSYKNAEEKKIVYNMIERLYREYKCNV